VGTIRYGTCSWSEKSWVGSFYAPGTRPGDMLPAYASVFDTVEADSSYYHPPSFDLVRRWAEVTPDGFVMSSKLPRACFLGGDARECDPEVILVPERFKGLLGAHLAAMSQLGTKRGPMVIQCPYFKADIFKDLHCFLARLDPFLTELGTSVRFALEIRNPQWLHEELFALLRQHRVAFCLSNVRGMPHPADVAERLDVITADFFYARLIGDRVAVEKITKTFDRVVIDQTERLAKWAALLPVLAWGTSLGGFVYANNHFAGHGPATVRQLRDMVGTG
jgi:uncharacterized protein YecE (DUF72 family)